MVCFKVLCHSIKDVEESSDVKAFGVLDHFFLIVQMIFFDCCDMQKYTCQKENIQLHLGSTSIFMAKTCDSGVIHGLNRTGHHLF